MLPKRKVNLNLLDWEHLSGLCYIIFSFPLYDSDWWFLFCSQKWTNCSDSFLCPNIQSNCFLNSLSAFAVCPNHWGWHYAYFNTVQMEICIYKSFPYLHFQVAGLTCWGCSVVDELPEASAALRGRLIRIRDCCASQLSTFWVSETLILTHR